MAPEITLVVVFLVSFIILKRKSGKYEIALPGRIAMAAMLVVTSIAHFVLVQGMSMMIPAFIPYKVELVYLTGMAEMAAAIGLLLPRFRVMTGWWLTVFFIVLLPANIYGAIQHVDLQKGSYDGPGSSHLWFRIPLQFVFIGWTYLSAIRPPRRESKMKAAPLMTVLQDN